MKKIMGIIFVVIITAPLYSQLPKMQIQDKPKLLNEPFEQRRDANGRLCAVIKVISEMEGLKYDSYNGIVGNIIDQAGYDLVYISIDERVLIIFHIGYEPLKIILPEIGIHLKEKQMWTIHIKAGASKILPISLIVHPSDANIVIDGKNIGRVTTFQITSDVHYITVSREGYQTIEDTILVDSEHVLFTYTLLKVPEMIFVEGGSFSMGSDEGNLDEMPVHIVSLNSFYIENTEVTQEEWAQVMGDNPSYFLGDSLPVERTNWYDVIEFCNKLSQLLGLKKCYTINKIRKYPNNMDKEDELKWVVTCDFSANGYRLPTEAEWEYACRGGNRSNNFKYSGSNDPKEVAWLEFNSDNKTHPVGNKKPNELGIYDMSGNVWEWCWDWYGSNFYRAKFCTNPTGPQYGSNRVVRGGSWLCYSDDARCTNRSNSLWAAFHFMIGFRVCRSYLEGEE